jgi:ribosomal protein S18 acetylase RimI-like enzyme
VEKQVRLATIAQEPHPLDNPVWSSLVGPHAQFGQRLRQVLRYREGMTPYVAFAAVPGEEDWRDLARLAGPGAEVSVLGMDVGPPPGWETLAAVVGVQMIGGQSGHAPTDHGEDLVRLHADDVPEMIDLTERTKPGPFLSRTIELGAYLGIRRGGRLVAMAGERLHPAGWSEISAVCTDEAWRGMGLATRLVRALETEIRGRGETPFLHVPSTKQRTIRLYEGLGFRTRRTISFAILRIPC